MDSSGKRCLRLLSYNIQAAAFTQRYRHYVTQSWKQLLPHKQKQGNLNRIAALLDQYDVVGLQEVDSGSLRSGFINQTEYLAHRAGYPFWYRQINRSLGLLAQHSNGLLSKVQPYSVDEYRLPGLPGRGVFIASFGAPDGLNVCILHLALGRRARMRQLAFVRELISDMKYVVLMGDLNCGSDSVEMQMLTQCAGLHEPGTQQSTFPSWRPIRKIDHILVSQSLSIANARVINYPLSDHLPIGIDVMLPEGLQLAA